MPNNLNEKAIQSALEGKWEEAIDYNLALINEEPANIAALNRLARAYLEKGDLESARQTYKRVLDLDKYNPIAKKNIKRLKSKERLAKTDKALTSSPHIKADFLEEQGKTKTSQLVRLTDADVIAGLSIGQSLFLDARKRSVCVKTEEGTYIGSLPDDLSLRLGKLLKAGNKYEVLIKGISGHNLQVFIRETNRSKRLKNTPSFPASANTSYYADIHHAILDEEPLDTRETGED